MIVELTGWVYEDDSEIKSIATEIGINDTKNFFALYGTKNSMNILRNRLREADKSGKTMYRTHLEVECGFILPTVSMEHFESVGMLNTRYAKKEVKERIIKAIESVLSEKEAASRNLDTILSGNPEKKIALIKEKFPWLKVLVFQYQNLDFDTKKNSIAVILDGTKVIQDETRIIGWDSSKSKPKLALLS